MAKLKPPNPAIEFGATIEDTIVPDGIVRMWSKLKGVRSSLDAMYGAGEWGDAEARHYVAQRQWERKLAWDAAQAVGPGDISAPAVPGAPLAPNKGGDIEAAVQHVMDNFPDLTEANRPMVRQREYYNRVLEQLVVKLHANLVGDGKAADVRQTQQMMTDIQREVRQIEKTLALDAGSLRAGGIDELRAEILKVMDRAKALLDKHTIRIACPACQASRQERHINLGWVLYHFRQDGPFHWFCVCPHPECGLAIHIHGGPGQETVIENGPSDIGPLRG